MQKFALLGNISIIVIRNDRIIWNKNIKKLNSIYRRENIYDK